MLWNLILNHAFSYISQSVSGQRGEDVVNWTIIVVMISDTTTLLSLLLLYHSIAHFCTRHMIFT